MHIEFHIVACFKILTHGFRMLFAILYLDGLVGLRQSRKSWDGLG